MNAHVILEFVGGGYLIATALATIFPQATMLQALAGDLRKVWNLLNPSTPPPTP